jgi:phosphatidate phosphatase APP1
MKNVRMNMFEKETYEDIWAIIASGSQQATFDQKVSQIRTIMNHFPGRTFTLIGDSGEKDPEVFRQIRAEYPAQVREIRIRVVSEEDTTNPGRPESMTWIPADLSKDGSCQEFIEAAAN